MTPGGPSALVEEEEEDDVDQLAPPREEDDDDAGMTGFVRTRTGRTRNAGGEIMMMI